jgi:predicted DNA-binding helix-hairpin-helix protein
MNTNNLSKQHAAHSTSFQFRLEPNWEQKLEILGANAMDDVDCKTCAANPSANTITHRALQPIAPQDIQIRPKDLTPWLSSVIGADGKRMSMLRTLMTSACEKDCYYCATRRGRNSLRRETFKPDELAKGFDLLQRSGRVEGLFLLSGVIGGGTRTMEKLIPVPELLRRKYQFRGYIHVKLMPGSEPAAIERALQFANRVSVNLEAPNSERLNKLSGTKRFKEELLAPLRTARALIAKHPHLANTSIVSQFIVGAAGEADREILGTTAQLYRELQLARIYYCAFHPIHETPLENHPPTDPLRELRLYETDFLLRQYGFAHDELPYDGVGNLPLHTDPKTLWAQRHPERFPLEINTASREELLRVPGLGPKSVSRILDLRSAHMLTTLSELKRVNADAARAAPFVLLAGKPPTHQLPLFE